MAEVTTAATRTTGQRRIMEAPHTKTNANGTV